ncbi:MAG TPA: hypothetical protein PLK94_12260 [Alphaproteobacteria bacterium]|nr:hypothetical protein [Alphaproteobacteria bacterium]HOO52052.1 hypothetical protein [Alphaproteobacteria bacterium]
MKLLKFCLLAAVAVSLSSCGQEELNNQRLAKGCEAAVKLVLDKDQYDRKFEAVQSVSYGASDGFKLVKLTASVIEKETDYELDEDEVFNCKFEETSSFGGMIWNAHLVYLKVDEDAYGLENGQIIGNLNDHLKLMNVVEKAMQ